MKVYLWIVMLVILLTASFSLAEYYKYTDENDVVRFTDNLQEVPQSQRKHVKEYVEIQSDDGNVQLEAPTENADGEAGVDIKKREEGLRSEKAVLDKEYEALAVEREELEAAAKKPRTAAGNKKFEAQIEAYNARTAEYEKKRLDFKKKVDAFNTAVDAQ